MTGAVVNSLQLRRHVVRVDALAGGLLGSGFFIAPGWVLTAAHVVFDRARGDFHKVVVTPAAVDVGEVAVRADVMAFSDVPESTTLWPFPDLALLRLHDSQPWVSRHPCVWAANGEPLGDDCHAYGFPPRELRGPSHGAPARFAFEGVDGDGFLRLKQGQADLGLSGAPLVCPTRRAVVGVMTGTRDRTSDLGGWAAPISALLGAMPGVPDELIDYGRDLVRRGTEAVLADRRTWHAVVPVAVPDELLPDWDGFQRAPGSLPAEMLLADSRVVPYRLRDEDLRAAVRWCEQPTAMEVWRFAGVGGAGKTRHAIELCRAMAKRNWVVVRWTELTDLPAAAQEVAGLPLPRLVVIDYVEAIAIDTLRALLDKLRAKATALAPVRVVLLTRTAAGYTTGGGDVLREIGKAAGPALRKILNSSGDPITIGRIPTRSRRELYDTAFRAFRRAWLGEESARQAPAPDLTGKRYEVPLEVLLEAFDRALSGGHPASERPPVDRALDHEARYWNGRAPAALSERSRRAAVAVATLAGAETDEQAEALLRVLPELRGEATAGLRRETVAWLSALYAGPLQINPVRPDLLGEALVAEVLAGQGDGGRKLLGAVLALDDDAQVARSLDLLARLVVTNPAATGCVAAALFDRHRHLVDRAEARAEGTAERPGRLDLAIGLQRLLGGAVETRMAQLAQTSAAGNVALLELSVSYNRIGDLARHSGQSERAEALYVRGLDIRRRLSRAHPDDDRYARELSISYNKLARLAFWLGQAERARGLYEQGLEIRERLMSRHPEDRTLARDYAVSQEGLAELTRDSGESVQAERLYRQVLPIRLRLCEEEPANTTYARDLSISYEVLGDIAMETGRPGEARQLYEQGHRIREKLWTDDRENANYARDLSNSYHRLGEHAFEAARFEEARHRFELALQIRQRLHASQPRNTVYAHDLLVSYSGLGELAAREGRLDDAERLYHLGLAVAEDLLAAEPRNVTFARDSLFVYMGLGELAARRRRAREAEKFYRLGRTRAERLLAAEPDSVQFARLVALFYEGLGVVALDAAPGEVGVNAEALLSAAVHFRRSLWARDQASVALAEDLAWSLQCYRRVADRAGRERARVEAREALEPFEDSGMLSRSARELLDSLRTPEPGEHEQ
ncbi:tetratricopeptide repeat protein [Micromonospora krabiensis]|uniref:Tetratricopeptide repeat-containing protein n=1 Tax=Micromonospora krabiensis TaxID=307121 RepID=A0A1C3N121_9ACTN|nr:tetratricopeptide repeat-containing serine protease family protein [Micromonospora krabiensis]SBV26303.1 Tetratricopeptide repeat-containing protein [Micromonospora krabiensis]